MDWDKITTRGWEVMILWKNGSAYWIKLKAIKNSNLVKVAEYVVVDRTQDKPAFSW